jgi:hypothetical protein
VSTPISERMDGRVGSPVVLHAEGRIEEEGWHGVFVCVSKLVLCRHKAKVCRALNKLACFMEWG